MIFLLTAIALIKRIVSLEYDDHLRHVYIINPISCTHSPQKSLARSVWVTNKIWKTQVHNCTPKGTTINKQEWCTMTYRKHYTACTKTQNWALFFLSLSESHFFHGSKWLSSVISYYKYHCKPKRKIRYCVGY